MFTIFRITAILEGLSYLALFAISMPLKYMADIREPNMYIGYAHGFLFIAYLLLAFLCWKEKKWEFKRLIIFFVASLLPFATFYVDDRFLKPLR